MIHSVFELGDTICREVMVPRPDMVWIERHKNLRQATSLFLRSGYSRIPVVGENLDDVVGVAYFKDVVRRDFDDPEIRDHDAGRRGHAGRPLRARHRARRRPAGRDAGPPRAPGAGRR
ncbi:CBS domain-containing protein [Nocardioides daphniae]|uniref:CBS domain-containing protein n=1 Tax=Nocardioides daphniae TaxID=402297 RepID=UPI003B8A9090